VIRGIGSPRVGQGWQKRYKTWVIHILNGKGGGRKKEMGFSGGKTDRKNDDWKERIVQERGPAQSGEGTIKEISGRRLKTDNEGNKQAAFGLPLEKTVEIAEKALPNEPKKGIRFNAQTRNGKGAGAERRGGEKKWGGNSRKTS